MIITRTPFRVSFAGGGSDLKQYYRHNSFGAVVSTAIQKYMYIIIHPYFHDKIRLKYSLTEDVNNINEIRHPIIRECLRKVNVKRGIEIASFADVPSGTGLGSSSAFTVGLLNALYAYKGKRVSKEQLASEACDIEIEILKEPIGKQDQYASAFGNINFIRFNADESVDVTPLLMTKTNRIELERRLRMLYISSGRPAGRVLKEQVKNLKEKRTNNTLKSMVYLAEVLKNNLESGQIRFLEETLLQGWKLKKKLASSISNGIIDDLVDKLFRQGIKGVKLLGAGEGGFLLYYSDRKEEIKIEGYSNYLPFSIDKEGTKVIFYE